MEKRLAYILVFLLIGFAGFSKSDPGYTVKPKAINLQEVAKSIKYPSETNANGIEGTVIVVVNINEEGNVTEKNTISFPCSQLKKEVEMAVEKLKFEPARTSDGLAVSSTVRIPFSFELTID